jgi:exonuclease III
MTTITLLSWSVNDARVAHRAGFLPWLAEAGPDILCLQETRCDAEQLPAEMRQPRLLARRGAQEGLQRHRDPQDW